MAIEISRVQEMRLAGVSVFATGESGEALPLLEEIDLTVRAGEWLYVVGVNGSGKSTLGRVLAGLHHDGLAAGSVDRGFAGEAASPIVLQRPEAQLFGETPREEVQFALEWQQVPADEIDVLARHALEALGLLALADVRWERLSGGQRQLAAVAAASALGAPLLLFDEATSMLDDANRQAVIQHARRLNRAGTSVVWVTQRLDELRPDERTIAVAGGRIVYDGQTRAFFYGTGTGGPSPCEACGLRLLYMARLAREWQRLGLLRDPLPMTEEEWREVLGNGGQNTQAGAG